MALLLMSLVIGIPFAALTQSNSQSADFVLVRGELYEGVIIPAASSWHRFVWDDPAIRGLHAVSGAWTPTAKQIDEAEDALQTSVAALVPELAESLPRLRRQYVGIISGSNQVILIHGLFDVSERWKTEARLISGAGCQQFWADFDTEGQKITTIRCGALD